MVGKSQTRRWLDESPTVMVGEATSKTKLGKNRGILKPSWAFVETNRLMEKINRKNMF